MGILATPSRGQPLDVDYIGQIATQVNTLTTLVGDRSTTYSSVNGTSIKTSDLKIFATTVNVSAATNKNTGDTVIVTVPYPSFNGNPVVTATIFSGTGSSVGDDATVTIKDATSNYARMIVTYNRNGNLDIGINVIAIGFAVDTAA